MDFEKCLYMIIRRTPKKMILMNYDKPTKFKNASNNK